MRRILAPMIAIVTVAACGKEKPAEPVAASDSSGVHIVTNRVPAWAPGSEWKVTGQPTLQIGGGVADTSQIVGPVAGAFRLRDGRVVVADRGAHALRWFSPDGTLLTSEGGDGEGPGEFRWMSRLLEVGDSIAVYDSQLRRLSLFDDTGRFARLINFSADRKAPLSVAPIGRLSTGQWIALATTEHTTGEPSGPRRDSTWIWMVQSDAASDTLIASLPGSDVLIAATEGFLGVLPSPFGRTTTIRAHDGTLLVGTADTYRLDGLDFQGRLITSIRLQQERTPLDSASARQMIDSLRRSFSGNRLPMAFAQAYREALSKVELPAFVPPYSTFRIADDSTIWVEDFVPAGHAGATDWKVFLADGRWQGTVTLPPGFMPTQIAQHEILGVWTDPDGVDHVVAYAVEHGTTP